MQRRLWCIPILLSCLAMGVAHARNIFIVPGDSSTSIVSSITPDPFVFGREVGTIPGAFKVVPATASKFYVLTRQTADSIAVLEGTYPALTVARRLAVSTTANGAITDGTLTADGRRLVVVGPGGVAVIDTGTDQTLRWMGDFDAGAEPVDVVASSDPNRVFVLSGTTGLLSVVDLTTYRVIASVSSPGRATSIAIGPNGLLYVTAPGAIYEYDPNTLAGRASIRVSGTPGELHFSPDGSYAFATSSSTLVTSPALVVHLAQRSVLNASTQSATPIRFTDVAVVDNTTAFGITSTGQLYRMSVLPDGTFSYTEAAFVSGSVPQGITSIEATSELPRARYLLLTTPSSLYRLDVQANQLSDPIGKQNTETVVVSQPPATGTATGSLAYATTQTVAAGGTSAPLVVRVYDANGLPLSGVSVVFSTTTPGVTFATPNTASGVNGYASTTLAVPSNLTTGSIPVTASIAGGLRTAQFNITVGNPNLPGIGTLNPFVRPGLQILAGQGQAVWARFPSEEPLRVRLNDAQGNPIANAPITWRVTQGTGTVVSQSDRTSGSGEATASFTAPIIVDSTQQFQPAIVSAIAGGQQADFYITTVYADQFLGGGGPAVSVDFGSSPREITLRAGEIVPNAISATVTTANGFARVPNISMRVVNQINDPQIGPYAECRDYWALSDAQGRVVCDLIAGPRTGTAQVTVLVGEVREESFTIRVEQGSPSQIRILSGAAQTVTAGEVTRDMLIEVFDAAGNSLPNVPVTWEAPANVTFTDRQTTSDINGRASARIQVPANQGGPISVVARAGSASATFTVNVQSSAANLSIVSGGNQTAVVGQSFAEPLSVRVANAQGQPAANVPVTFTVTSGSATVATASAQTNAQGIATTNVTAGQNAGPVVVTAATGGFSQAFNLTVRLAGPVFTANDVLNAAGFLPGVSPGSLAYIRVSGIVPTLRGSVVANQVVGPLPLRLSDVEVLFNNIPAPIYSVSNLNNEETVVVQVPFELNAGFADVTIRTAGGASTTVPGVQIMDVKPGVFTFRDTNGQTYAVATRASDGSYITSANPARLGEQIRIYATGLGQTSPATATNRVGLPNQSVSAQVIAGVNNAGTRVISAELLPGTVGVYVVTMEVPADTTPGTNQPVGLAVTDATGAPVFANGTAIPIV